MSFLVLILQMESILVLEKMIKRFKGFSLAMSGLYSLQNGKGHIGIYVKNLDVEKKWQWLYFVEMKTSHLSQQKMKMEL